MYITAVLTERDEPTHVASQYCHHTIFVNRDSYALGVTDRRASACDFQEEIEPPSVSYPSVECTCEGADENGRG